MAKKAAAKAPRGHGHLTPQQRLKGVVSTRDRELVVPSGLGHISRLLVRDERRQEPVKWRLWKQNWIDPYPEIPGTVPEKMLYAQLKFRRIEFVFQALGFPPENPKASHFRPNLGEIRPDFLIPSVRAVIEVQGTYFHTKPEAEAHDLDKLAEYHAWGWYAYWMFDLDIVSQPARALEQCPEASGYGPMLGMLIPKASSGKSSEPGATTADANAVAQANRNRARKQAPGLTARVRRGRRKGRVLTSDPRPDLLLKPTPLTLTAAQKLAVSQAQASRPYEPKSKTKPKPPAFFRKQRKRKRPIGPFG